MNAITQTKLFPEVEQIEKSFFMLILSAEEKQKVANSKNEDEKRIIVKAAVDLAASKSK